MDKGENGKVNRTGDWIPLRCCANALVSLFDQPLMPIPDQGFMG